MALVRVAAVLLLGCLCLCLLSPAAAQSKWNDVSSALIKLDTRRTAQNYDPNKEAATLFSDPTILNDVQGVVESTKIKIPLKYEKIHDYLLKVRSLRATYHSNTLAQKPRAVVVGGGPIGGLSALLLASKGQHQVTVLEKTNGVDDRWNAILAQDSTKEFIKNDLGIDASWIGSVSEMEYVLLATLKLVGVDVRFNRLFMQVCSGNAKAAPHKVYFCRTPAEDEVRYHSWTETEVCGHDQASFVSDKKETRSVDTESLEAVLVVGADGTAGAVRSIFFTPTQPQSQSDIPSFPSVMKVKAALTGMPANENQSPEMVLHTSGHETAPLLKHVIVSFVVPENDVQELVKADESTTAPEEKERKARATLDEKLSRAINSAVATNLRGFRAPLPSVRVSEILMQKSDMTADDFFAVVASSMPHLDQEFVDSRGNLRKRHYVEMLLRHSASDVFDVLFGRVTSKTRDMEMLVSMANGKVTKATDYNKVEFSAQEANVLLADKLFGLIYRLYTSSARGTRENKLKSLLPSVDEFKRHIEHIKIFSQNLRRATGAFSHERPGLKVILAGDSMRDSYYAFGNSVNSAFNALSENLDQLLATNAGANEAATYYQRGVQDFVNFIGSDIFYRTRCSAQVLSIGSHRSSLKFSSGGLQFVPDKSAPPTTNQKKAKPKKQGKTTAVQPQMFDSYTTPNAPGYLQSSNNSPQTSWSDWHNAIVGSCDPEITDLPQPPPPPQTD